MKHRILIVEDDAAFGTMLRSWFERNGYEAVLCAKVAAAKEELGGRDFGLILCDLRLPDGDGIVLLEWAREQHISTPLIIMTSYAGVQSAVAAIKLGAEDYLEKPIVPAILREKVEQALNKTEAKTEPSADRKKKTAPGIIVGESPAARQMLDYILKVAPTKMTTLILGESGSGKEYAAKLIHDNSPRRDKPFLAVDCGSLSRELAPSELFGHLKGSFTSAVDNKTGVFEQADGGTVFLDEVGNLSYDVQVQLLRALQEQKIRPVGSAKDVAIDVRILAATNEDLPRAIAEGAFREDLYHRLNEFSLCVPALRDRGADIRIFAEEFLRQANAELERDIRGFSAEAMALLEKHRWSGNLRELRNVVRRAALFTASTLITPDSLPAFTEPKAEELALRPSNEKEQIEAALRKARGNKSLAAQLLQIDRKTLYNKMHLHGIKL